MQKSTCRSGFMTLPPVLLQEQPAVVLLWGKTLASWLLVMDERGGHQDLCGSGHRSVIPYEHGRIELYCTSLPCLSLFFFLTDSLIPMKWRQPETFISQGWVVTMSPKARQVASGQVKPYATGHNGKESSCLIALLH
jgi:hypothetical protein